MIIEYQKEELGNFIPYELDGNALTFNDELTIALDKYERDDAAHYDVCFDKFGCLVMGVIPGVAELYAAQIDIPARQYINADSAETDDDGNEIFIPTPVPYDPANTTLTLWGREN
jgi:hypothetical protein